MKKKIVDSCSGREAADGVDVSHRDPLHSTRSITLLLMTTGNINRYIKRKSGSKKINRDYLGTFPNMGGAQWANFGLQAVYLNQYCCFLYFCNHHDGIAKRQALKLFVLNLLQGEHRGVRPGRKIAFLAPESSILGKGQK